MKNKKSIMFLGKELDQKNFPVLYEKAKNHAEELKRVLLSLAKQPGGSITNAMQCLESDLQHG